MDNLGRLIRFLERLEEENIYYRLNKIRDSIMIEAVVQGERWEIEFFEDGNVVIEKFITDCEIYDETELEALFRDIDSDDD